MKLQIIHQIKINEINYLPTSNNPQFELESTIMIEPPICKNPNCEDFNKWSQNNKVVKIKETKDRYICKKCNKEFKWSMPKPKEGIIY